MRSAGIAVLALWCVPEVSHRRLAAQGPTPDVVTLSVVGTNDLHGSIFERNGRGGLAVFAGYVNNVRAARAADGGGVLLLDAGDTFQGGIDSNLSEGAVVIDAYNALGYAAAAIGNHELDFGAVDPAVPGWTDDVDPRGALKAIAARATFPLLTANLLDQATGRLVDWPNVAPSVLVEIAGIKVGIVGVMTIEALRATLVSNTRGLRVAPLAPAIVAHASQLRARGATVVIVTAHAGGRCTQFGLPTDLSSCDAASEIFQIAKSLPQGLVDVIVAGHSHAGLAHQVEGIAIIESFSAGQAFGRVDIAVDRSTKRTSHVRLFPPRDLCTEENPETQTCDPADRSAVRVPARYEGHIVKPDPAIIEAMAPTLQRVRDLQAIPLGVFVETPLARAGDPESPLGNLFADALRESTPGVDVAINNNAIGGLRADLPVGSLTFGALYDVFSFDNRIAHITITGAQLRQVFAEEIQRGRRGALGISGVRVRLHCSAEGLRIELLRSSGHPIADAERLAVVTADSLASGAVFAAVAPAQGFELSDTAPIVREVVADWLRRRGGRLRADQFVDPEHRRWEYADEPSARCTAR
jgi:5'-nucleotidase